MARPGDGDRRLGGDHRLAVLLQITSHQAWQSALVTVVLGLPTLYIAVLTVPGVLGHSGKQPWMARHLARPSRGRDVILTDALNIDWAPVRALEESRALTRIAGAVAGTDPERAVCFPVAGR